VIRVVVVDDQELVRAGFRAILETQPDLTVVGEAGNGAQALSVCATTRPDVVLMDIRMPVLDGITATTTLLARPSPPRVLVLTTFDLDEYVYAALKAGASGFLLKNAPRDQLLHAVRAVAAGDALLAPSITRKLIESYVQAGAPTTGTPPPLRRLSPRELDVLTELATGRSNLEIARQLHVSEATVKTHVAAILTKLGLRDRTQAIVLAYETGFVRPGR
jgi:DNA-binding NarL/FixJ family response regulator